MALEIVVISSLWESTLTKTTFICLLPRLLPEFLGWCEFHRHITALMRLLLLRDASILNHVRRMSRFTRRRFVSSSSIQLVVILPWIGRCVAGAVVVVNSNVFRGILLVSMASLLFRAYFRIMRAAGRVENVSGAFVPKWGPEATGEIRIPLVRESGLVRSVAY
jgi:hypothetical protein